MSQHRFGTPERIAIDVDVEPDESLRGSAYLTIWVGGTRLGATDIAEALDTFLAAMKRWVDRVPPAPAELAGQPADAVFAASLAPEQRHEGIALSPNGCAPFDGEYAFVLQEKHGDRVVCRPYGATQVSDVQLPAGEVAATVRALLAHAWRS